MIGISVHTPTVEISSSAHPWSMIYALFKHVRIKSFEHCYQISSEFLSNPQSNNIYVASINSVHFLII